MLEDFNLYPVIAEPPVTAGGTQETMAEPLILFATTAVTVVGESGIVTGITADEDP